MSSNVKQMSSKIFCDVCNKEFNTRQAKSLHKKKCTFELYNENEIKMKEMELQLKSQEKEILKLKLKLQKSKKADIATINQLNKLLLERHNKYQNYINNINNGNIYNNFQLVGFGKEEDIVELLTNKEKNKLWIQDINVWKNL
jgi:hypothetical protein